VINTLGNRAVHGHRRGVSRQGRDAASL